MINIFEDLQCKNIENHLLNFECKLEIFREGNLIFVRLFRDDGVFVLATGPSICVALERAESYIGGAAHFSMPDICLSTKSKLDKLILEAGYTIIAKRASRESLTASLLVSDNIPKFVSCASTPFIGGFLAMMEERI